MTTAARRRVEKHLKQPYGIQVERGAGPGGEAWVARVDELPGCTASGDTPDEAEARVRVAMRRWFEQAIADGRDIPRPRGQGGQAGAGSSHSGRLLLRMPSALHAELAKAAERDGVSLNQLIVGLLSRSLASPRDEEPAGLAPSAPASRESRTLRIALAANLVVLVVAGAVAVGLLVVALTDAA